MKQKKIPSPSAWNDQLTGLRITLLYTIFTDEDIHRPTRIL